MSYGGAYDWPLSPAQEDLFRTEVGARAWSWAQDCNPFEINDPEEVLFFVLGPAEFRRREIVKEGQA